MQPSRLKSALEGINSLAFEYAALRDVFKEQRGWERMHTFVAPSKYCHTHEAAALNTLARRALVCVEEVGVNSIATVLAQYDDHERASKPEWELLLECTK